MNVVLSTWNLDHIRRRWPMVEARLARAPRMHGITVNQDGTVEVNGVRLASVGDRQREAAMQAETIPPESLEAWVYGVGLGDLPRFLLQRPQLEKLHVVILHESLFTTLLEYVDQTDWLQDQRVSLEVEPALDELGHPFCVQSACLRLMPDHGPLGRLKGRLFLELSTSFVNRDFSDNPVMRQRLADNAPLLELANSVSQLYQSRPNTIMVVAGAGPTLAKQLTWMAKERKKLTIIATASALRSLMHAQLVPDVVVAIDPFPILAAQFDLDLSPLQQVPLVFFPILDSEIIQNWPGPKLVALSTNPLYASLQQRFANATLHSGGSVIHPATHLAVAMGGEQIILAGCDFSFPGGQIRDEHSPELSFGLLSGGSIELVNGNGQLVKSVASMRQFLLEMESFIQHHPQVRFYNASREGARIEGTLPLDKNAHKLGIRLTLSPPPPPAPIPFMTTAEISKGLVIANVALRCWRLVEAHQQLNKLLRAVRQGGDPLLEGRILLSLAEAGVERGRLREAREPLEEIPEVKPQGWSTHDELNRLCVSAWCHLQEGSSVQAGKDLDLAMALAAGLGQASLEIVVQRMVCQFYSHLGRLDEGEHHLHQALQLARQSADPWEEFRCLRQWGELYLRRQEWSQSRESFQKALNLLTSLDAPAILQADVRNQLFFLQLEMWKSSLYGHGLLANCCRSLRRGEEAWAYDLLIKWIDGLLKNPNQLAVPGVKELLPEVIAAQQRRDGIALADILEYGIAPALKTTP
ncbi:MAG: DUF115 domain-containing protein [Magnetococcales bacterium]|nr:DUF115 domain-containing protein [Magnetococcales bacterium]NGZ25642.1 DUF115 domain-containing protein [Magnetococcales bacterium]